MGRLSDWIERQMVKKGGAFKKKLGFGYAAN